MNQLIRVLMIASVFAIASVARPASAETISIGGASRSFIAQLPDTKPAPLVIVLHGNTQTGAAADACHPSRPVPVLMMNGTADPLIPYQGGRGASRFAVEDFWSTERTLAFWRRANGCETPDGVATDLEDRDRADQSTVTK